MGGKQKRDTAKLTSKQKRAEHRSASHCVMFIFWTCYEMLTVNGPDSSFHIHYYVSKYFTVDY